MKILKKWGKNTYFTRVIFTKKHFTHVYQKLGSDDVWFLRYGTRPMEGWTDRQKEK